MFECGVRALGAALTVCVAVRPVSGIPPEYTIDILDAPVIHIDDMNIEAEVVGWTTVGGNVRAYVAGPEHPYELLPLPEGYASSWAKNINDAGVIVGSVGEGFTPEFGDAVVWTPIEEGYDVTFLGALPGHDDSVAMAVNNVGDIVGYSIQPGFQGGPTVWFNSPGGILDLSDLGAPSSPQDLNDERVLCGWNGGLFDLDDLTAMPLPGEIPPDWAMPLSWAINEHGELAGYSGIPTLIRFATRYTLDGGWEVLGNEVGSSVQAGAYDINRDGSVVLETNIPGHGWGVGAYFDGEGTVALENLLGPDQGAWTFVTNQGDGINDRGQIAAIAVSLEGQPGGLAVLSPVEAVHVAEVAAPARLGAIVPTPFRSTTAIGFVVSAADREVWLDIFSIHGRHIRGLVRGIASPGRHEVIWNGMDDGGNRVAPGVYLCRLRAGTRIEARRVHLAP